MISAGHGDGGKPPSSPPPGEIAAAGAEPIRLSDREAMARALALAERGRGTTRPNPMVGCVIVADGQIVGEGWHERAGQPHAEILALRAAGDRAHGATAYVTLEPCNHHGRTPPCTEALLAAGVRRVVVAADDPNPLAQGGGAYLANAGVTVDRGVLADWARLQNEVFHHVHAVGRPHVTLKLAQTLDGHLAIEGRRWITGPAARVVVHRLRARCDAVMVGVGTVLADDPRLDVRDVAGPQPRAVVLDAGGRTPPDAAVVREGTIVVTTERSSVGWRSGLADGGVEVLVVPPSDRGVDLPHTLGRLLDLGIQAILSEGGQQVARSLVAERLVDRLVSHIAVSVVGPSAFPTLCPAVKPPIEGAWGWRAEKTGFIGPDLEIVAEPADRSTDVEA